MRIDPSHAQLLSKQWINAQNSKPHTQFGSRPHSRLDHTGVDSVKLDVLSQVILEVTCCSFHSGVIPLQQCQLSSKVYTCSRSTIQQTTHQLHSATACNDTVCLGTPVLMSPAQQKAYLRKAYETSSRLNVVTALNLPMAVSQVGAIVQVPQGKTRYSLWYIA